MMEQSTKEVWERQFSEQLEKQRRWPSEELIAFIEGRYPDGVRGERVLEVGYGSGNNLWYLLRKGFRVRGIDHSETASQYAASRLRYEEAGSTVDWLPWELEVGSIEELEDTFPDRDQFDGVIDVRAIQHLDWEMHKKAYSAIEHILKPNGWFFSVHLTSGTWDRFHHNGRAIDRNTIDGNTDPSSIYPGVGVTCMPATYSLAHLIRSARDLEVVSHELVSRSYDGRSKWSEHSVIVAEKILSCV